MRRWKDLQEALRAALVMCRVAFALRWKPFPDLLRDLRLYDPGPSAPEACVEQARTSVRRAHRLLRNRPHCLLDSLTAAVLVRRQGYSVPLAIGVRRERDELQAHAWLGAAESPCAGEFRLLYRVPEEN